MEGRMTTSDAPWFVTAFGRDYLAVYAHRDDASARGEAEFAARALGAAPGARVLDLGCGAGRHSRALSDHGLEVVGVDLSADLLAAAAGRGGGPRYVRGDMRRVPLRGPFDAATLFFTSFGYFAAEEEDRRVLGELRRLLRPGGVLLLDGANRSHVLANLVPESIDEVEGFRIRARRRITPDGTRVEKQVVLERPDGGTREYVESVRLYAPEELAAHLEAEGFRIEARYGDLAGTAWDEGSPRLVLVGRRT